MSSTGNFRGQRTQSSTNGYKTLGSSIASGNNGGAFKRIFINALGNSNGNYDLALTKTLGIPRHYYNSTSNSSNYQQPTLSGKKLPVITSPTAETLTQVFQSATVASTYKNIQCCPTEIFPDSTYGKGTITLAQANLTENGNLFGVSGNTYTFPNPNPHKPPIYSNLYINNGIQWLVIQSGETLNINFNYQNGQYPIVHNSISVLNGGLLNINGVQASSSYINKNFKDKFIGEVCFLNCTANNCGRYKIQGFSTGTSGIYTSSVTACSGSLVSGTGNS
jgi:hypothetical protein